MFVIERDEAELEALKNAIRQEMHCALPAVVESYDKATQTVTVKPAIREQLSGGAYVELPLLSDVPVFFPGGAASGITFPVQKGDECLVIFSDSCIDAWYQYGGTQNPVSLRRHDLSDGFAFIGFRSRKNALPSVPDTPSFFGEKADQDGKGGKAIERTQAEMDADVAALSAQTPTEMAQLKAWQADVEAALIELASLAVREE